MVGVMAVYPLLVFKNRVCVWASDSSLFSARSADLVDASAALVVLKNGFNFIDDGSLLGKIVAIVAWLESFLESVFFWKLYYC